MAWNRLWLAALAAALGSTGALAAERTHERPASGAQVKRRTILHFGEDDIRGDITRPDGELVQAPRKAAQQTLLRVRRSFVDRALAGAARGQ